VGIYTKSFYTHIWSFCIFKVVFKVLSQAFYMQELKMCLWMKPDKFCCHCYLKCVALLWL
jgi:hypothetical protein